MGLKEERGNIKHLVTCLFSFYILLGFIKNIHYVMVSMQSLFEGTWLVLCSEVTGVSVRGNLETSGQ